MGDIQVDILIPTYKPDKRFGKVLDRLYGQIQPIHSLIIMNTEEGFWDSRLEKDRENMQVHHISRRKFDHGGTRRQGASYATGDILVCMTQDALPKDNEMLGNLIRPLGEPKVAASYARQLPAINSPYIEAFTRKYNYPANSSVKWEKDLPGLGVKTFFCSNVCAAYDRKIYQEQGGFIPRAIFNEDMIYGAGLIRAGYGIAYAADAQVIHSHNYNCRQQFRRNFDLGVSQAEHPEIFTDVPSEREGIRMVAETARCLLQQKIPWMLFQLGAQSAAKYLGYLMGKHYKKLPEKWIQFFTANPGYWKSSAAENGHIE